MQAQIMATVAIATDIVYRGWAKLILRGLALLDAGLSIAGWAGSAYQLTASSLPPPQKSPILGVFYGGSLLGAFVGWSD